MTHEIATGLDDVELIASCAERALALGGIDRRLVAVLDGLLGSAQDAYSKMIAFDEPSITSLRERCAATITRLESALATTNGDMMPA